MLHIEPFKALRYNPEKIQDMANVLCPPYDVISAELQDNLYAKSPYNAVKLELPKEPNRYEIAYERLTQWIKENVILRDNEEAIFPYHQHFTLEDGTKKIRKGIIALCKLYDFREGVVLPHEKTLSKAKEDRLQMFIATKSNLSPIFGIYDDKKLEVDTLLENFTKSDTPMIDAMDYQHVQNIIWKVSDKTIVEKIKLSFLSKKIYIADGHHRYETALLYRDLRKKDETNYTGKEAYNYIMMYIANMRDEGMVALPTHRLVHSLSTFDGGSFLKSLKEIFTITKVSSLDEMKITMKQHKKFAYGIVLKNEMAVAVLAKPIAEILDKAIPDVLKNLDLTLLHKFIIEKHLGISEKAQIEQTNLYYSKSLDESLSMVRSEKAQAAFILNQIEIDEVISVSEAGHIMPQKSTFFYPKVLTGVTFNSIG